MDNAGRERNFFLKDQNPPFPILESSQLQPEIIIIDDDDDEPAEDRAANLTIDLSLGGIYQNDSMSVLQDINRPRFHAESSSHPRRRGKESVTVTLDDDEDVPPPVAAAPHRNGKEPIMNDQPQELSDESDTDYYNLVSPTWIDVSSVTAPNTPEFRDAIAKFGEQNNRPDLEGFSFAIFSHDVGPEYIIPQGLAPILTPRRRNGISLGANPREPSSADSDAIIISTADPYGTAIVAKLSDDNLNNSKINDQSKHMYSLLLAANLIDIPMQAFDASNDPSKKPILDTSFVDVVKKMPVASVTGPNGKKIEGFIANYCSFRNEVVIVCQCHREFFSSEGFVAHAGITDLANAKKYIHIQPSSSSK